MKLESYQLKMDLRPETMTLLESTVEETLQDIGMCVWGVELLGQDPAPTKQSNKAKPYNMASSNCEGFVKEMVDRVERHPTKLKKNVCKWPL